MTSTISLMTFLSWNSAAEALTEAAAWMRGDTEHDVFDITYHCDSSKCFTVNLYLRVR